MAFIKPLLWIGLLSLILFFLVFNFGESLLERLWPGEPTQNRELLMAWAVFIAFWLGIITHLISIMARDIRLRAQIGRLRRENRSLQSELHHLRGASLDDLPIEEDEPSKNEEGQAP